MKPRSLMFTLYGEYIEYYGGEVWVGSLIQLMHHFGVCLEMTMTCLRKIKRSLNS